MQTIEMFTVATQTEEMFPDCKTNVSLVFACNEKKKKIYTDWGSNI